MFLTLVALFAYVDVRLLSNHTSKNRTLPEEYFETATSSLELCVAVQDYCAVDIL